MAVLKPLTFKLETMIDKNKDLQNTTVPAITYSECCAPFILDACCGGRIFWFDKQNPDVLFTDCRREEFTTGDGPHKRNRKVLPDQIEDFRNMSHPDETFKMVVFDPPHLFVGENSYMGRIYGRLDRNTWKEDLRRGFTECFRVLKIGGFLIFKWNECDVPVKDILALTDQKPLFGHPSGKAQATHWICFMKRGEEKTIETA